MRPEIEFHEGPPRKYLLNGEQVPSVTQILGVLDKPALPWWGMTTGIDGICQLQRQGVEIDFTDPEGATKLLTEHKLTVNHRRDSAATRGKSVHTALESYCADQSVPQLAAFPVEDRGYVMALASALLDLSPEPLKTEVIVGSLKHSFAGRYDLLAKMDGRTVRVDLKTGAKTYPTSFLQLEAYELAALECDEEPSDARMVLRLGPDGSYELTESYANAEMFLGVLAAYRAMQALKDARPPQAPEAPCSAPLTR